MQLTVPSFALFTRVFRHYYPYRYFSPAGARGLLFIIKGCLSKSKHLTQENTRPSFAPLFSCFPYFSSQLYSLFSGCLCCLSQPEMLFCIEQPLSQYLMFMQFWLLWKYRYQLLKASIFYLDEWPEVDPLLRLQNLFVICDMLLNLQHPEPTTSIW